MSVKPATERDGGFTLVELLVVMLIIGVLAAIAIPVLLTQRGRAHDSATQADVSNLGKEIAAYWIGGTGPVVLDDSEPGRIAVTDGSATTYARLTVGSRLPVTGATAGLDTPLTWCAALTDPQGLRGTYHYSARAGLEVGDCS